jgi:hypothetical protein
MVDSLGGGFDGYWAWRPRMPEIAERGLESAGIVDLIDEAWRGQP